VNPLTQPGLEQRLHVIHREIPLSVIITGWDVPMARAAMQQLVIGLFEQVSQMTDAIIMSDSRVQAGLAARLSILGRPISFKTPTKYRDSSLARECRHAFEESWPDMAPESVLGEMLRWEVMQGFGISQIIWDTTGDYAIPLPLPWHPKYSYFHWLYRCYVAITMDGQEPIIPGNGSWMLHARTGGGYGANYAYRSWMRGAVGAITPWWLGRAFALRDWMRYSERHGLPMIKLKTPSIGDPWQQAAIRFQCANLGQEAVFHLPQNPPPALSYDIELMEARDTAHEGFRMLIEQCNQEITLALNGQTLTTSMPAEGGSSYAAARVHASVLQGIMEADASALAATIYHQLARPFAAVNFGNADLAPRVTWDVSPYEDALTRAKTFQTAAQGLQMLMQAGIKLRRPERLFKQFMLDVGKMEMVEPLQIAAQAARASGQAEVEQIKQEGGDAGNEKANMARLQRLMGRLDPRLMRLLAGRSEAQQKAFLEGTAGLREAMAWGREGRAA
jgi:phage gp29-like protein